MARFPSIPFRGLSAPRVRSGRPPRNALVGIVDTLLAWQERANARHHLSELDAYLLRDMGISRLEAAHEAAKPFWRD